MKRVLICLPTTALGYILCSAATCQRKKTSFHDPVHGHIELHPLLIKIIDTPQFQRLRKIRQLGGTYHVYPGASHNRFEHSIGTCHLAGKFVRHIRDQEDLDEKLKPKTEEILAVEIAGLCHDLGHGPFSHAFDLQFKENVKDVTKIPKHEELSQKMLDHLIKTNNLEEDFRKAKVDLEFVKELIHPKDRSSQNQEGVTTSSSIDDSLALRREYLCEIISNKETGVDVDKWDYFARDCHHLGIRNSFDHNRFMALTKVLKHKDEDGKDRYHICVREKESKNLYEMFHTRDALYRRAYHHPVTKAVEQMICDALHKANDHITFKGEDGVKRKISDTVHDMAAYEQLNDGIVEIILRDAALYPQNGGLQAAQNILNRLAKRELYVRVGEHCSINSEANSEDSKRKIVEDLKKEIQENGHFDKDDYFVFVAKFDYGQKASDPVNNYLFYSKNNEEPTKVKAEDVSLMLPKTFMEYQIFVFCKFKEHKERMEEVCNGSQGCLQKIKDKYDNQ